MRSRLYALCGWALWATVFPKDEQCSVGTKTKVGEVLSGTAVACLRELKGLDSGASWNDGGRLKLLTPSECAQVTNLCYRMRTGLLTKENWVSNGLIGSQTAAGLKLALPIKARRFVACEIWFDLALAQVCTEPVNTSLGTKLVLALAWTWSTPSVVTWARAV